MKFKPTENSPEELIFDRLISEDGKIFMGVHVVIFGYRVRAGYVGSMHYEMDWCGGADQHQVEMLYSLAKNILENKGNFIGVPDRSKIKPFFNDPDFVTELTSLVSQPLQIIKLKPLHQSRTEITKHIINRGEFI